jgi:hypothetical protein
VRTGELYICKLELAPRIARRHVSHGALRRVGGEGTVVRVVNPSANTNTVYVVGVLGRMSRNAYVIAVDGERLFPEA